MISRLLPRPRLPLLCAGIAAGVTLLAALLGPSGDAPSHLFQTWLYQHHGFSVWNNDWYAGRYEFVTYSVFYYPLAAHIGQLGLLVPAAAVLGGSFAAICRREWGSTVTGPSIALSVTAPFVMIVAGVYPFMVATATAGLAVFFLQRQRRVPFALAVLATLGFSPLAFALLVGLLAAIALGQVDPLRAIATHRFAFAAVVGVFITGVFLQRAFPSQGWYPYDFSDGSIVLGFSLAGLWITGKSPRARSLRMLFAVYLALNLVAFLLKSPIGSNGTRLWAIAGAPLLWLAANISKERSRMVVVPLLALAAAVQIGPWVKDAYSSWGNPAARSSYWRPAVNFLRQHPSLQYRVEAVATSGHWDAYYLADKGVPLARGWYRQDDFPDNAVLYNDHLTALAYQHWLRSLGVRYVLLPDTKLDFSSRNEARLLRSGRSGLTLVAHTTHWQFYALPDATAITSAPTGESAFVTAYGPNTVQVWLSGPGRYVVRVHYSPYWVTGPSGACITPGPDGMTAVTVAVPSYLTLRVEPGVSSVANTVSSESTSC